MKTRFFQLELQLRLQTDHGVGEGVQRLVGMAVLVLHRRLERQPGQRLVMQAQLGQTEMILAA